MEFTVYDVTSTLVEDTFENYTHFTIYVPRWCFEIINLQNSLDICNQTLTEFGPNP